MKKMILMTFLCSTLMSIQVIASLNDAARIYATGDKNKYLQLASELAEEKMYFSATPFIKEYLASFGKTNNGEMDKVLDQVITGVGIKQFEVFPTNILERSNAPIIRYILARRAFRRSKYDEALKYLQKNIEDWSPVKPFALLLEGSIYAVTKKEELAVRVFKECIDVSNDHINKEKNPDKIRQLKISRDYCIVGISRSQFAVLKFDDAYSSYLDLQKASYIWPEILFEEAWNSFYLKDYNRTLGKLVTYKAPVLDYIFNPENDVLAALTYMELCLWADSNKAVEDFYTRYEKDFDSYKKFVTSLGKDYKQFYTLVKDNGDGRVRNGDILNRALKSISRDPAYIELSSAYNEGKEEIEKMRKVTNSNLRAALNENLRESMTLQRNLMGSYVRGQLLLYGAQMQRAFEDMSYIKLEALAKRKSELYGVETPQSGDRKRGDIATLKRTDKQYFWTFNGEFWADELGDYVFSLKSECK